MKALVKAKSEVGIWMDDVPMPEIEAHEVLIKVQKTSICGTDMHIYKWDDWAKATVPVPMVTGHEYGGEASKLAPEFVASVLANAFLVKATLSVTAAATRVRVAFI